MMYSRLPQREQLRRGLLTKVNQLGAGEFERKSDVTARGDRIIKARGKMNYPAASGRGI